MSLPGPPDMPTYVYQVINADGSDGETFEIEQPASDPALTTHPWTGLRVRRVFHAPNLGTKYPEGEIKRKVTDKAYLESQGFTRYERDKLTGTYHKTAGTDRNAPDVVNPRDLPQ